MTTLRLSPDLSLPSNAITQTFGVLAVRGAGKTNLAVVMAEEMCRMGLPFVVVDPVGNWWGLRSSADGTGPGLPIAIFGAAAMAEIHGRPTDSIPVFTVCSIGVALSLAILSRPSPAADATMADGTLRYGWLVGGFLVGNPVIGLTASSVAFLMLMMHAMRIKPVLAAIAALALVGLQLCLLSVAFDIRIERDILGRLLWWVLSG